MTSSAVAPAATTPQRWPTPVRPDHPAILMSGVWLGTAMIGIQANRDWLRAFFGVELAISPQTWVWLGVALIAFTLGSNAHPPYRPRGATDQLGSAGLSLSVQWARRFMLLGLIALAFQVVLVTQRVGGPSTVVSLLSGDWAHLRGVWISSSVVPGQRLLQTLLISSTSLAAVPVLSRRCPPSLHKAATRCLVLSLVALALLPLASGQRILFLWAVSVACLAAVRMNRFRTSTALVAAAMLLGVWTIKEFLRIDISTNSTLLHGTNPITYPFERIAYYFGQNLYNVDSAVTSSSRLGLGISTPQVLREFGFTPGDFATGLVGIEREIERQISGGTFTGLGAPFREFGWFGASLMVVWGAVSFFSWAKARESELYIPLWTMVGTTILLSFQTPLYSEPNWIINLLAISGATVSIAHAERPDSRSAIRRLGSPRLQPSTPP